MASDLSLHCLSLSHERTLGLNGQNKLSYKCKFYFLVLVICILSRAKTGYSGNYGIRG